VLHSLLVAGVETTAVSVLFCCASLLATLAFLAAWADPALLPASCEEGLGHQEAPRALSPHRPPAHRDRRYPHPGRQGCCSSPTPRPTTTSVFERARRFDSHRARRTGTSLRQGAATNASAPLFPSPFVAAVRTASTAARLLLFEREIDAPHRTRPCRQSPFALGPGGRELAAGPVGLAR